MALFSRRRPNDVSPDLPTEVSSATGEAEAEAQAHAHAQTEDVPHVAISVNTFGKGPESAQPLSDATESPAPQGAAVSGLPDNALLQQALRRVSADPEPAQIMNVMRQALQGRLYVRVQGDARELLAEGHGLSLAMATHADKRFLLVFSGGAAVQASAADENAGPTSALGQPASHVLQTAVESGYDGISLDHATPGARLVLPIGLVKKALDEGAPAPFELKNLTAGPRTADTGAAVAEALTRVPVWVAGRKGEDGRLGLAEGRSPDGVRRLEVYSHPLEVIAMGRGDGPLRLTPDQLASALASDPELTGIVIDPAGPWIELDRGDLTL